MGMKVPGERTDSMSTTETLGKPYVYQCEHVTGTAKFYGETVEMAECPNPAELRDGGEFLCEKHAR